MAQEDEQDDAARAFEDLTAEVRVMRRALEALQGKKPVVDYAPTLAALTQELERLTAVTANMARRPAMALTPDSYAAQLRRAADEAARPAAAELQRVQTLTSTLERALGGIRTREEQRRWVLRAATGGIAAGVFVQGYLKTDQARPHLVEHPVTHFRPIRLEGFSNKLTTTIFADSDILIGKPLDGMTAT